MTAIIDGDSLVWKCAYFAQTLGIDKALENLDEAIKDFLKDASTTHYIGFLAVGEEITFRKQLDKEYKGNRKAKPDFYSHYAQHIIDHLAINWSFKTINGLECDDAVAIQAAHYRKIERPYTIIGVDKDLLQIEGTHYNPDKKLMQYIDYHTAQYNLYKQILTGDQTDNIKGLAGIGPVKAKKILDIPITPAPYSNCVLNEYQEQLGKNKGLEEFCKNSLLVMLKESEEGYTIPEEVEYST